MLPHEVQKLKGRSLIFLIRQFDLKKSHDRRDRIYSLLALCGDGSDLQVDYGCRIDSFMERILHCCKQSFCLCSVQIVASALDPERISCNFFGPIQEPYKRPFAYILLPFFAGPTLPLRECNSQPCQVLGCDGTKWSHTPGYVHQFSSRGGSSVVLYPRHICSSTLTLRMKITMWTGSPNRPSSWTVVEDNGITKKETEYEARTCCTLTRLGDTCKVCFSFGFLVTRDTSLATPCDRVCFQGTEMAEHLEEPLLHLCSH